MGILTFPKSSPRNAPANAANKDGSNIEVNSFKQQLGVDNLPFVPIKDFITKEAVDKLTNNGSFGKGVQSWFDPLDSFVNIGYLDFIPTQTYSQSTITNGGNLYNTADPMHDVTIFEFVLNFSSPGNFLIVKFGNKDNHYNGIYITANDIDGTSLPESLESNRDYKFTFIVNFTETNYRAYLDGKLIVSNENGFLGVGTANTIPYFQLDNTTGEDIIFVSGAYGRHSKPYLRVNNALKPNVGYKSKGDVYDLVNFNGLTNSQLGGKENVTTPSGEWSLLDNDVEQDLELPITGAGYFSGLQPIAYVSFDFKIEDPNSSYNSILNFRNGDLNQTAGIYIGFDRIYANGWSSSGILAFNGIPNLVFGETYHLDIKVDFVNLKVYVYLDDVQILDETDGDNISANTTNKSELDFRLNKKFYIKNFKSGFDGIPNDLVLIHNGLTTPVSPEKQAVIIPVKTIDAITLNTDLIAEVSNDGTNWEQVALEDLGELTSGINYLYGEKDMINIGTTPKVRVRTQNNKDVEIHGIGAKWL